jgi:hypothetical protein
MFHLVQSGLQVVSPLLHLEDQIGSVFALTPNARVYRLPTALGIRPVKGR